MIDERFSAYLDGEASPEEVEAVLSALGRDPELRAAWGRQHWLRSALRDADTSASYDPGFAERVRAALEADEAAPAARARVLPFGRRRSWSAAAGLAAAASVVGVMLLAPQSLGPGDADPGTTVTGDPAMTTASSAGDPATTAVASAGEGAAVADARQQAERVSVSDPNVQDRLNGYLLEHNGLARGYGLSGATPTFLRVATHGQDAGR